jgi:fucose 4-O-acetylase-like acetyltransferase
MIHKRVQFIDVARGIAMVLVVLGHAMVGVLAAGLVGHSYRFLIIGIYTFHMAVFFVISGLLATSTMRRSWPDVLKGAALKIVYPYFLWGGVLSYVHYLMSGFTNSTVETFNPLRLIYQPPAVMWFLYVLLIAIVFLRLLRDVESKIRIFTGVALLLFGYFIDGWLLPYFRYIGLYILAFELSILRLDMILERRWLKPVALAVSIASLVIAYYDYSSGYPAHQIYYLPGLLSGTYLTFKIAQDLNRKTGVLIGPIKKTLALIGRNTMAIYVSHILLTAGVRIALVRILGIKDPVLITFVATACGIFLPLFASLLAKSLKVSKYIGWE